MSLTNKAKKRIKEKIMPFFRVCLLCGNGSFILNDDIHAIPIMESETKKGSADRRILPTILIECDNCHHMFAFHAIRAGIIDQ